MNHDLISYYAQRAHEYDLLYQREERIPEINQLAEHLTKELVGLDLLEIACGTGYWTHILGNVARNILATDINQEVLEIAKVRCNEDSNVSFKIADVYSLENIRNGFEAGLAGYIWSHIPKQDFEDFINVFHSKIKKGGKVIFIDNNYVDESSTPIYDTDQQGNTYQKRTLKDGSIHSILKNFPSKEEILDMVKAESIEPRFLSLKYYWLLVYRVR